MIDMLKIGESLRAHRSSRGYSMKQLSEKIDVCYNSIWAYETGYTDPPLWVLVELTKLYDIPIGELIGERE